jgi:hypothetical protein
MKTIRLRHGRRTIVGFTNGFITYGRNVYSKYRLEVKLDWGLYGEGKFKLYQGEKKPALKNIWVLTFLLAPITPLFIVLLPLLLLLAIYIEGAINFVKETAWQQSVREFNWINIVLVLVLAVWLILK